MYLYLPIHHKIFRYYGLTCRRFTQIVQVVAKAVVEHVKPFVKIRHCDNFHGIMVARKVD